MFDLSNPSMSSDSSSENSDSTGHSKEGKKGKVENMMIEYDGSKALKQSSMFKFVTVSPVAAKKRNQVTPICLPVTKIKRTKHVNFNEEVEIYSDQEDSCLKVYEIKSLKSDADDKTNEEKASDDDEEVSEDEKIEFISGHQDSEDVKTNEESDKAHEGIHVQQDSGPKQIGKKLNDWALLKEHFQGNLKYSDIPNWYNNSSFINMVSLCPAGKEHDCHTCEVLCFSKQLRSIPPKTVDWYYNIDEDSCSPYYSDRRYDIKYKFYRYLLPKEQKLRDISRLDLLKAIVNRFRGYYDPGDCIDRIKASGNWSSFDAYLKWKDDDWDDKFRREWINTAENNDYCSGCGIKTHIKFRKGSFDTYQVCAEGYCDYYRDNNKNYAIVKKIRDYYK